MNRKAFLQAQGATCKNWNWSWSFINEQDKLIIFGAWQHHTEGNTTVILDESWKIGSDGRKSPGYGQSLEHTKLVESGLYTLKVFPMVADEPLGNGRAKIKEFVPQLFSASLARVGGSWYATFGPDGARISEEVTDPERYFEGALKVVTINAYERNLKARVTCIAHHGVTCTVCGFNFERVYGAVARNYIHVHHLVPISSIGSEYILDPVRDLRPVCPNCHAIIHKAYPPLSIEQLKEHIRRTENA